MRLIPRSEWTPYQPSWVNIGKVSTVFIHHTVTSPTQEIKAAMRDLESHALALGHRAIDYSFVVNQSGQRAEGRGWWHAGGHTINNNSTSYGIAALGDYRTDVITDSLIDAYAETIREGIAIKAITENPAIRPHSDVFATACPGRLKDAIPKIKARLSATPEPRKDTGEMFIAVTVDGKVGYYWHRPRDGVMRKATAAEISINKGREVWMEKATYDFLRAA